MAIPGRPACGVGRRAVMPWVVFCGSACRAWCVGREVDEIVRLQAGDREVGEARRDARHGDIDVLVARAARPLRSRGSPARRRREKGRGRERRSVRCCGAGGVSHARGGCAAFWSLRRGGRPAMRNHQHDRAITKRSYSRNPPRDWNDGNRLSAAGRTAPSGRRLATSPSPCTLLDRQTCAHAIEHHRARLVRFGARVLEPVDLLRSHGGLVRRAFLVVCDSVASQLAEPLLRSPSRGSVFVRQNRLLPIADW